MMDCPEIRNLLSEVLDDALDAKAKALAEEHLRTCASCREELDSLKSLVKGIRSLEPVKAPADFLDQLHKRMERTSRLSKIREWIFYPLRVKIPLQLAGAAVAALIIFSILPLQQSSLNLPTKPEQKKKNGVYSTDEAKERMQPAERSEAPVQKSAQGGLARDKETGKPAASSEALVQNAATPRPAKKTREVALKLKKQVGSKTPAAETSEAPASAPPAQEMQGRKLAVGASAQEDKKEEALEKAPESVSSITRAIEAARGKVLSVNYNPQTGRPESIRAELPAGEITLLYEKLRELGDLRVSPEARTEKDSDLVQLKIRVLVSPD